jgi:Zn-finger protein
MNFNKDWFKNKLVVGSFPLINNLDYVSSEYDYVINVSDEYYPEIAFEIQMMGCRYFWFPMNECKSDIGVNSIYGACTILYLAEQENKSVYLHCHAGINRSQIVYAAYYFMRTGEHIEKKYGSFVNSLVAACNRNYLPAKKEMEEMLLNLNKILNSDLRKIYRMGGQLDVMKLTTIK